MDTDEIEERKLTPETLENHRITFELDPSDEILSSLPVKVGNLRQGLLSYEGRLLRDHTQDLEEDEKLPDYDNIFAKSDIKDKPGLVQKLKEQKELAREIWKRARSHSGENVGESTWQVLLLDTVFKSIKEEKVKSGHWNDYESGYPIVHGSNLKWNSSINIPKHDKGGMDLTSPKPDIYLGFPVKATRQSGFGKENSTHNFSLHTIGELLKKGLIGVPTTGLRSQLNQRGPGFKKETSIKKDDRLCFPWAIVELKHEHVSPGLVTFCYCQAANAASRALRILDNLAKYSDTAHEERVPVVVTMTFIGPEYKLWIAYTDLDPEGFSQYKMICIEKQRIDGFWGALRLCQIVEDMCFWGSRILKPQLSMYIDQWRSRHMKGLRFDLLKDSKISDLVEKIEERGKEFGLARTSNLSELVHMAMVIQEIFPGDLQTKSKDETKIDPSLSTPRPELLNSSKSASALDKQPSIASFLGETPSKSTVKITPGKRQVQPVPFTFKAADKGKFAWANVKSTSSNPKANTGDRQGTLGAIIVRETDSTTTPFAPHTMTFEPFPDATPKVQDRSISRNGDKPSSGSSHHITGAVSTPDLTIRTTSFNKGMPNHFQNSPYDADSETASDTEAQEADPKDWESDNCESLASAFSDTDVRLFDARRFSSERWHIAKGN